MRKSLKPGQEFGQELGQERECRALSAGRRFRQAQVAALALMLAAPIGAAPGGEIDTMPLGDYVCELPGDASGPAGNRVPAEDFSVVTASSYRAGDALGSYLLMDNG